MIMEVQTCKKCGRHYLPNYDDSVVQTGLCFTCWLHEDDGKEITYGEYYDADREG